MSTRQTTIFKQMGQQQTPSEMEEQGMHPVSQWIQADGSYTNRLSLHQLQSQS